MRGFTAGKGLRSARAIDLPGCKTRHFEALVDGRIGADADEHGVAVVSLASAGNDSRNSIGPGMRGAKARLDVLDVTDSVFLQPTF